MERIRDISIILNDRSYEYDIYTLVIAFFQGRKVQVLDLGDRVPGSTDLTVCVIFGPETILVSLQAGPEETTGGSDVPDMQPEEGAARLPEETAGFFMERELPLDGKGEDRMEVKNLLKRNLYEMLSSFTSRELPWGTLTGIRPVKLAMDSLNGGNDSASVVRSMRERYYVSEGKAELAARIAQKERSILNRIDTQNGYSLYIGIPFCPSICLYCSFSSSPLGIWKKRVDEYLDALIGEITACRSCFPGKQLHSVYIGGGTPTTLEPDQMDRLLCAVEDNFDLSGILEFTVEAGRPDSITRQKLEVLRKHRVSRISINPQTMNQKTLDLIGRRHSVGETVDAFHLARELGFDNINMDLIVGLPGEGLEEVDRTMKMIEQLGPDDVTVHALALKRAARLALHMDEYEKISFFASDRIMELCQNSCKRLGMEPYYLYRQKNMAGNFENVGYAKSGKEGIYNILIMEEVECILALGASGSTKIVHGDGRIERIENVKDIRNYLERIDEMIARKTPIGACLPV